ncbi:MAG: hypothetical protein WA005_07460, partial [Candidatus Binataceae bacterium]
AYQAPGDVNPSTANLTDRGLQRSLRMATFLREHVLGTKNVTGIYVLEPMTHLQTTSNYPDMVAPETIQQFALLNHITLNSAPPPQFFPYTGNSYPLNATYASGSVPGGFPTPTPACPGCQGLDFNDQGGDNDALVTGIVEASVPGFYVFSAPWETTSALLANINKLEGYNLTLPASYAGPNYIYAISIAPSGSASLVTFNSNLHPPSSYPALPSPRPVIGPCTGQAPFAPIQVTGGIAGAKIPGGINKNETLYIIRHADAHPLSYWTDGNYVCAGQWRALDLPNTLAAKMSPNQVYSIDPAQTSPGTENPWSSVAPSLTAEPYAIANNLPYGLAASFEISDCTSASCTSASDFFFFQGHGGKFSNQTVLLAWAYQFIQPMVNALVASYFPPKGVGAPTVPEWPDTDYDTIWTVTLDAEGNLTVNNELCEGIDSAKLPETCPQF